MIAEIQNIYLRRAAMVLFLPWLSGALILVAGVGAAIDEIMEQSADWRRLWRG